MKILTDTGLMVLWQRIKDLYKKISVSAKQTTISTEDGGTNVMTFTFGDGTSTTFSVKNGSKGSDGARGATGEKGEKGDRGPVGETGPQGNSGIADASNKALINDAVTGGETSYLSAEVGKLGILTYDCSKGGTVEHASLQDAINAVPTTFRKVGITIIYKSGDSIYRYALKSNSWSTDSTNWFSVEEKVSELKVADALGDGYDAELSLTDDNGYAIAQFRDGHIKTKNFDSRYVNSELGNLPYIGEKICVKLNKFSKELLFKESKSDINSQGCAVFDKYLFQFYNSNNVIDIFDLVEKTLIQTIALEPVSTYHCNNANFGNEYYAQNDLFPLLYVSQENELEHKCLVYRVTNGPGEFVLTLVQTITFPSPSYNFMWYPNCMIDVQNNKIIIAGLGNKPWSVGIDNIVRYKLFTLPKLSEGDVTIAEENCEDTIEVKFLPTTQGGFVLNNKIIQVFGMGNNAQLNVIDITTHRLVSKVDLSKNVLSREPEGCFLYEDAICVVFDDGQIFKLIF